MLDGIIKLSLGEMKIMYADALYENAALRKQNAELRKQVEYHKDQLETLREKLAEDTKP